MRRTTFIAGLSLVGAVALPALFARAEAPTDGGAIVSVQVAPDGGDTTISVLRGEVKVRAAGQETRVSRNQAAHVRKGQRAQKVSLLPAPDALKPADGSHLATVDVALAWAAVPGASAYHLAVATDARFQRVHDDEKLADARAAVHLPAGTYYWRVSAVDRDGLEGKSSAAHRLVVDLTPPKLKTGQPQWR